MPTKQVHYDARSLNPSVGDKVTVLIQHLNQDIEVVDAIYLGSHQLECYTTPYFKFLTNHNQVRLINSNAVREWKFQIATPDFNLPQIEAETSSDDPLW